MLQSSICVAEVVTMKKRKFKSNKNPLKDKSELDKEIRWNKYRHKDEFTIACTVRAIIVKNRKGEDKVKLDIPDKFNLDKKLMNKPCVYIMVINERIFKIGHTESLNVRIEGYNTLEKGTDWWVAHSIKKIDLPVIFYAWYPIEISTFAFGEKVGGSIPSTRSVEKVLIKQYKLDNDDNKPVGNKQG